MSTQIDERTDTTTITENQEPGDHERLAHYANKVQVMESAMTGNPVIALCGKVWTPGRDPKKFPICPECQEVMDTVVGTNLPNGGK